VSVVPGFGLGLLQASDEVMDVADILKVGMMELGSVKAS
jgi:hypothetical protein